MSNQTSIIGYSITTTKYEDMDEALYALDGTVFPTRDEAQEAVLAVIGGDSIKGFAVILPVRNLTDEQIAEIEALPAPELPWLNTEAASVFTIAALTTDAIIVRVTIPADANPHDRFAWIAALNKAGVSADEVLTAQLYIDGEFAGVAWRPGDLKLVDECAKRAGFANLDSHFGATMPALIV